MSKRKPRRCWSKSIGERGYRVRVYEARPGGTIMRSVYVNGKEARKSLGHRDKQLAIQHAYELLHALFANETAIEDELDHAADAAGRWKARHLSAAARATGGDERVKATDETR